MESRRIKNSLIGSRIQFFQAQASGKADCSPMMTSLMNQNGSKVKKVLELYEKKPWSVKSGVNWWMDGSSPLPLISAEKAATDHHQKFDDNKHLAELLLHNQRQIAGIQKIINRVGEIVGSSPGFMAMKLRDYNFYLFGDLEAILALHKSLNKTFALQEEGEGKGKCIDYIKTIVQLIDEGKFYCYCTHKMLEHHMMKLHDDFIFISSKDRDKFNVFDVLHGYQQSIGRISDILMRNPTRNADDASFCLDAEQKLLALIDLVADAGNVSRIAQISDVPMDIHFRVFDIIKKKQFRLKNPILLLVPTKSDPNHSFRCPIDVMQLGRFIKTIQCPDLTFQESGKKKLSNFFIFEYCVVHTSIVGYTFCFEDLFWIRDVSFRGHKETGRVAELVNNGVKVRVDDCEMTNLLITLRKKHRIGEIQAEIEMAHSEVIKIAESIEDLKKWRRHTIIPHP